MNVTLDHYYTFSSFVRSYCTGLEFFLIFSVYISCIILPVHARTEDNTTIRILNYYYIYTSHLKTLTKVNPCYNKWLEAH